MAHHLFHSFVLEVQGSPNRTRDLGNAFRVPEQTYWNQSAPIDDRTVCTVAERIADHAQRHGIDRVEVVLRGGEPLLIGLSGLRWIFHTFRSAMDGVAEVELRLQTSGVPLDERFAELFLATDVQVGIILAGGPAAHDRQLRFGQKANRYPGGSSYAGTVRAVRLLGSADYRPVFGGLLCPVDVANDPVRVFEDLAELDPPKIDLLLPQASWEHPPPEAVIGRTPYGDWLVALFDHWYGAPPKVGVRLFEEAMHALLRGVAPGEVVASAIPTPMVIDAAGSIEQNDTLAAAFDGAPATGYNVFEHSLDDVREALSAGHSQAAHSLAAGAASTGWAQAAPTQVGQAQATLAQLGRAQTAVNPSVYARDLTRLISHIQNRMAIDLSAQPELVDIRR